MRFRGQIILLSAALLALLICYLPYLVGAKDFVIVDCQYTYQPVSFFVHECLSRGTLPFWNPHSYCGFPQLAVTSPGLFYPFNYLLFLLPFSSGEAAYLLLHQLLSGAAAFYLTNKLSNNFKAAAFASLTVTFCGYLFAMHKYPDFVASVCWLLMALAASCAFFREKRSWQIVSLSLLCLSAVMLFACGRPEIFIPGLVLLGVQAVGEIKQRHAAGGPASELLQDFFLFSAALACGLLIAAPAILPAAEWMKLSPRSAGLPQSRVFQWSATWYDWLAALFWQPFGDLDRPRYAGATIHALLQTEHTIQLPFIPPAYMGPAFFTAALLGLLNRSFKQRKICLWLIIGAALAAAGDQTPLAPSLLHVFPAIGVLRYPIKLIVFALLPAVLCAAAGITWILDASQRSRKLYWCAGLWLSIAIAAVLLYYSNGFANALLWLCTQVHCTLPADEIHTAAADLFFSFLATGLLGFCFAGSALLYRKRRLPENAAFLALLLFSIGPMVIYGMSMWNKAADGGYYRAPVALSTRLDQLAYQENLENFSQRFRILDSVKEPLMVPDSYRPASDEQYFLRQFRFGRDVMLPNTHFATGWNDASGYALAETSQTHFLFANAMAQSGINAKTTGNKDISDYPLARICALSATKYLITNIQAIDGHQTPALNSGLFELADTADDLNERTYRVKHTGSRIYFATNLSAVKEWEDLAQQVCSGANHEILSDDTTFVSARELAWLQQQLRQSLTDIPAGVSNKKAFLRISDEKPDNLQVDFYKKSPGLLVLRDQFYPGWKARVDGKPVPLLRANLFNRAVFVPAGEHRVSFTYEPDSLQLAVWLSLGGFLTFAATLFFLAKRRAASGESAGSQPTAHASLQNNSQA